MSDWLGGDSGGLSKLSSVHFYKRVEEERDNFDHIVCIIDNKL